MGDWSWRDRTGYVFDGGSVMSLSCMQGVASRGWFSPGKRCKAGAFLVCALPALLGFASAADAAQLRLSWADNSSNERGFEIWRRTDPGGTYAQIAAQASNQTSYVDTTVTAGARYCYQVRAYNDAGDSAPSNEACATASTATLYAVAVTKAGTGGGTVTSAPSGLDCGSACSASFESGTSVALSAAPASGSTFTGWSGACMGTGGCTLVVDAAKSVTATFTLSASTTTYTLTLTTSGTGSGTVTSSPSGIACNSSCSGTFAVSTTVTLTAAASTGSTFTGWSGACTGTGTCTVTMSRARSVTATFADSTSTPTATPSSQAASSAGGGDGGGGGSGGGSGGCFIATAAFGSPMAPQVQLLREVRDTYLLTNGPGRAVVQAYYAVSPPIADVISRSEVLRAAVRFGLLPVLGWAFLVLWSPGFGAGVPLLSLVIGAWWLRRRSRLG
jgi:hypothetical protein